MKKEVEMKKKILSLKKKVMKKKNKERKRAAKKENDKKTAEIKKITQKVPEDSTKNKKEVVESYQLNIDKAKVNIYIEKRERGYFYNLSKPEIDIGTSALIDNIRKELVSITSIAVGEIIDEKSIRKVKKRFMEDASRLLMEKVPDIQKETEELLIGLLMQDMLGLGEIEFLINDPELEEIVIVSSREPVRAYHKKYVWLNTNIEVKSEEEINNYANIIARRVGRQITLLTPLLDAHMVTGDRANAVLYPIATKGNTITIRKFARDPWTI